MSNETPRIRSLLRQADRNVESGKLAAAEAMYRQIVEEAPESTTAWLGLAQATRDQDEKQSAYERVLELDPEDTQAQAGLSALFGEDIATIAQGQESEQNLIAAEDGLDSTGSEKHASIHNAEDKKYQDTAQKASHVAGAKPVVNSQVHAAADHDHGLEGEDSHAAKHDPDVELFCYRHPGRSTSLRCYKCNKPICSECAVKTPVGYLCPTCHREAEDAFFNNKPIDYILAALVALPLSLMAGWLVVRFSGGIFMILLFVFAGGAVGGFIARLSKRAIGKRRGRFIPHVVAACIIIGALFWAWPWVLVLFAGSAGVLIKLAGIGVYMFTAASSAFYWAR